MADGINTIPIRWLFGRPDRRRRAIQYWVGDRAKGLLIAAAYEGLKALPIDACSSFGAMMAKGASRRYSDLDARARENLKQIRPGESDSASIDATMSRLWRSVARTKTELSVLGRLWRAGRIAVEGIEHLDAARAANRPILGVVLHLGNWEAMGIVCSAIGYPVTALYTPDENWFEEQFKARVQRRHGAVLIPAGPRAMRIAVRTLNKKTGQFGIFIDEVFGGRQSAPAFGRPLRAEGNIAFAARLAWLTKAEVIPAYCLRIGDQARFKVTFQSPVELVRDGVRDVALLTNIGRINAVVESIVRPHLDQWGSLFYRPLDA
jgi:Kdo2-lipid IVA lauroyltransferase/acyltransferase